MTDSDAGRVANVVRSKLFCSDAARLRGDDATATAARVDLWILVELPVTWGREPIDDAALPAPVRARLKQASSQIRRSRVVFIRKRVEPPQECRVYLARSGPRAGMLTLDLPSIDDVASLGLVDLAASELPPHTGRPLVLVCTHGQHDSCCGRRGYPLYDALRQREDLDVWQCSHIGGDRFAANAVVLPWGLYYGPVESRDASVLADAVLAEEIFLPAYRGRSSIARPAQAAETHVRRTTGLLARDAIRVTSREDLADGRVRIHLRDTHGTTHTVTIEQFTLTETAHLTCTSTEVNPVRQFRVVEHTTSQA